MNKQLKHLMCLAIIFFIGLPAAAARKNAPEVEMSNINGSIQDVENSVPYLKTAYFNSEPKKREDGLLVGKLTNKSNIIELAKEIAEGKHGKYDSLLIAHNDKLVFESYYQKGRVNLPHPQASATKGYISFAVGRAIQLGYLSMEDLHKPVLPFLKDVDKTSLAEGVEKITLHHTLSMRSGLNVSAEKQEAFFEKVALKKPELLLGQKLAQAYFTHSEPVTAQSQKHHYQNINPQITMLVLDAVVPGTAKDFIKAELLDKLGITQYFWQDNVSGVPEAAYGSGMTSRDMIKWGKLLLHKGKWQGEQLISEEFLTQATGSIGKPHSDTYDFSTFRYGYYFWGTKISVDQKQYDAKLAWGGGGQYVIALDELDLVVAVTARIGMKDDKTLKILEKRILPTFLTDEKKPRKSASFPTLEGPYMGQTPPGMVAEPFAPGIISKEGWELEGVFAPGMKEFYFTRDLGEYTSYNTNNFHPTVIGFRQENNIWKKIIEFPRQGEIVFSPDGKRMHMASGYRERIGDGWSERLSLGPMFDREDWGIMRLSVSAKGTYVFDDFKSNDAIRISTLKNGKRQPPIKMGPAVNTGKLTAHPFIAQDESYLIWDSVREGGYGGSDLYISFRQKDGSWGPAINMGDKVNSEKGDTYASVTPDGKYILFNRKIDDNGDNLDIYWVDAKVIEDLRPEL